jgi:hypothetical protein
MIKNKNKNIISPPDGVHAQTVRPYPRRLQLVVTVVTWAKPKQ